MSVEAILAVFGGLWLGVFGVRHALSELTQGPASLTPPKWWAWSDVAWWRSQRSAFVSWMFIIVVFPTGLLELVALDDSDFGRSLYVALGVVLVALLGLMVTTAFTGKPSRLVPKRLRDGPNYFGLDEPRAWPHAKNRSDADDDPS